MQAIVDVSQSRFARCELIQLSGLASWKKFFRIPRDDEEVNYDE